jgi:two-component system LytT family response regulator
MIRCMIVEDKPLAIDILSAYMEKIPDLELVFTTQNPLDALAFLRKADVDLIFLDIQMPELSGLQFMKLRAGKGKVILTTAYTEYALDGYEYDVIDYLLKPIGFDRFYQAIEKARGRMSLGGTLDLESTTVYAPVPEADASGPGKANSLFVKTEHRLVRIPTEDILYIEARQNYCAIVTTSAKTLSLQLIKDMEDKLDPTRFMRVHKSYIVALHKIDSIERSRIFIGSEIIPIGDTYRENLLKTLGQ